MTRDVVILAAGQGSRMRSHLPKVLHPLAGKALVQHVIDQAQQIDQSRLSVVIGHGADRVKEALSETDLSFYLQAEQLGTGHAVAQALPGLDPEGVTLVLYGDVPLTPVSLMQSLIAEAETDKLSLLTVELQDPTGYGRIIRNDSGQVIGIVEQKDASAEQLEITEVNTGILALPTRYLIDWLPRLSSDNAQGEYYLTDLIAMAAEAELPIETPHPSCEQEVQGVNDRVQLAELERWLQSKLAETLMRSGVTLADPTRIDIRGHLEAGRDCSIDVNCVFEGQVQLGANVSIGPNTVIKDSVIADGAEILANSHIEGAHIGPNANIGPFARIRPGTTLAENTKVGNFVETKKAQVGKGSKINHLSYVGDAEIGEGANIGAGTITCNYDGVNKFQTLIGDGAFIGSNSSLVAPVEIGEGATVGAGSTLTHRVEANQLAVARGRQKNIDGWKRPTKQKKD